MNFGLNLWNKVFGRMFGFIVMLIMTLSGHPWIINKMRNLQEQVKKVFCYQKFCSDLSLFDKIVLVISAKFLQILGFQKFFSITRTIFSHNSSEQFWQLFQDGLAQKFSLFWICSTSNLASLFKKSIHNLESSGA